MLRVITVTAGRAVVPVATGSVLLMQTNEPIVPLDTEGLTIQISIPSDIDGDGDADLVDFSKLQVCFGNSPPGRGCIRSNLDNDQVIGLADHSQFYEFFGGP